MKLNVYRMLVECIEIGVRYGLNRSIKYDLIEIRDDDVDSVAVKIEDAIMNEICEYFSFDDDDKKYDPTEIQNAKIDEMMERIDRVFRKKSKT